MLEGHGYGVLVASSARQALEVASASAAIIQVLLTDVVMPDTPGRELAERVWALRPGVRTIFLSWYPRETLDQKGWLAAGAELLQKPFSESTLLTVIRRVLDAGGE
jgi:CheY-like chemotaxis protein